MKNKVAVIVPAYNEAEVIADSLTNLLQFIDKEDIFVVDDGSSDGTAKIAKRYLKNVLSIPNGGKANAMNAVIKHFNLTKTYKYVMPLDADTIIDKDFFRHALPRLEKNKKAICVIGKITGQTKTWVNVYRQWEYEISQLIHKKAQAEINTVVVCPGCATIFRSEIFEKVSIPSGTQTEDMDFTFLINRKNLGRILYEPKAFVITQDPENLKDLFKQLNRWYIGFWQCLIKHNIPWGGQKLDLEVGLLALEGLFNGLLVVIMLALMPFVLLKNPLLLAYPLAIDLLFFLLPTLFYVAKKRQIKSFLLYIPVFYYLRFVSSMIFVRSFLKIVVGLDIRLPKSWNTNRYKILWLNQSLQ